MKTISLLVALWGVVLLSCAVPSAYGQYDLTPTPDSTHVVSKDSTKLPADSLKADSAKQDTEKQDSEKPKGLNQNEIPAAGDTVPEVSEAPNSGIVPTANMWLRRLLYRGTLDASEIGAYAQYQITPWDEKVGSYGAVEARLTVYYLGTSEWMGRDAEWLQAVYQTVEGEPTTVEYDLIVPSASPIKTIHRALYRVDGGETKSVNLGMSADQLDYDAADKPAEEGTEQIKLYSGTFTVDKLRGSGTDGSNVVMYRSKTVPPLDMVRLGYGDMGLTLTGTGSDAAPRWDVPPPPSVTRTGDDTGQH